MIKLKELELRKETLIQEAIESMANTLDHYDYNYSYNGLSQIAEEWFNVKKPFLLLFNGKTSVSFAQDIILEDGEILTKFEMNFYEFYNALLSFHDKGEIVEMLKLGKTAEGQKIGRYIRSISQKLGIEIDNYFDTQLNDLANFNKLLCQKQEIILSCNPQDYLTMSIGNSWGSCYNIDKNNVNYNGIYKAGTLAYIVDTSTIVSYIPANNGTSKHCRMLAHCGANQLILNRIYPAENSVYRELVLNIFNTNYYNNRLVRNDNSNYGFGRIGYNDLYNHGSFYQEGDDKPDNIVISVNYYYCPKCGQYCSEQAELGCCNPENYCEECGCSVTEDSIFYNGGGYIYCQECYEEIYSACEECGNEMYNDDSYTIENKQYCENCYNNNFVECENCYEILRIEDTESYGYSSYCTACYEEILENNEDE